MSVCDEIANAKLPYNTCISCFYTYKTIKLNATHYLSLLLTISKHQ